MQETHDTLFFRCSVDEGRAVRQRAHDAGLSISNYLRRCVNSVLLEEGDDSPLIEERSAGGNQRSAHAAR